MSKRPQSVTLEDYARIHRPDLAAAEAAKLLGVTPRTITRYRARLGVSQPSHGGAVRPSPELLAEIAARLDDGWPVKEVCETFHVCHKTVTRHFPGRAWTRSQIGRHARLVSSW
ncbi:DNA binding protein [Arthrobacter phage Abidatro]|uniref:Helix-turn-helix DNA-binding domain protein n=1 Tax=Arthrobacter phage Abidatro TaxID=2015853 RepID=A0A222ZGM5_9CAUD|nr:DNA binding protein [Arthrobacter phage Abidatro]ASR83200.1 helix-turn-helix DNA-binding domain protein [Arthrobacter phage Abidatro]